MEANINDCLKFLTWNTTGIMSSCTYLCDTLTKLSIDICGIAEHWLYEKDLRFLDLIDSNYRSYAISDYTLSFPSQRKVGKGGVALIWHKRFDGRISILNIEDDRIVGIQLEVSQNDYVFVFQVYLPCSNHPVVSYTDYLDKICNLINIYSEKGTVLIMGDFNANLMSSRFHKSIDGRCRKLQTFLNEQNLVAANTLELCTGARSSFVSYDGEGESLIDHFLIPIEKVDLVKVCSILEDDALNTSRHRPIYCALQFPLIDLSRMDISIHHINWKKITDESICQYQTILQNDHTLVNIINTEQNNKNAVSNSYNVIVESLNHASDICFPKTCFKKFLKPYWNETLSALHKDMKSKRINWINVGRPRNADNKYHKSYKNAKRVFRRVHRHTVENHLRQLHDEIDKLAEVDSGMFWREVNRRRKKTASQAGSEIKFNGRVIRDPQNIANEWGKYFRELYTPSQNVAFDSSFKSSICNELENIMSQNVTENLNEHIVYETDIEAATRLCKKGKACGDDNIFYEHIIYGGPIVCKVLANLFTSMLKLSYAPAQMKRGIIITLHKGGRKRKDDPNNYRAITLSSVLLKLYERILLFRIESNSYYSVNIDSLQGGFQKQVGCIMTAFSLKEAIYFSKENKSKLYVCFLDVRKAFDTVWHEGLFYKMYQFNIHGLIFKAIIDLYSEMESRVKYQGCTSAWFKILQGSRQGGVISPPSYLMFINDLLRELKASGYGFCIYNINFSSPTVADDMVLISFSKQGLDMMMQICYQYSLKWWYEYNATKSAVIVFNESETDFKSAKLHRTWYLGPDKVEEVIQYRHLGIYCDKYMGLDNNIDDASSKLKRTFLSLINSGINETGFHPITSKHLYSSVVLPTALYGSELWSSMSRSHLDEIEKAHRFCIKYTQALPKRTRTDIAFGLLGVKPIEFEIDIRKLTFLGQLCRLPSQNIHKQIFNQRLVSYTYATGVRFGLVPDIMHILDKYSLNHVLQDYLQTGHFMSKCAWKDLIKTKINSCVATEWQERILHDNNLCQFAMIHDTYEPCKFWTFSKSNSKYLKYSQICVKLIALLFTESGTLYCRACGLFYNSSFTEHVILYCKSTTVPRIKLWDRLLSRFGVQNYKTFISLTPYDQVIALLTAFQNILSDEQDKSDCLKIILFAMYDIASYNGVFFHANV